MEKSLFKDAHGVFHRTLDFAGKTFEITDPLTGEIYTVVVFVAILPYSQYIYAEGMLSVKEPQWIDVNGKLPVHIPVIRILNVGISTIVSWRISIH